MAEEVTPSFQHYEIRQSPPDLPICKKLTFLGQGDTPEEGRGGGAKPITSQIYVSSRFEENYLPFYVCNGRAPATLIFPGDYSFLFSSKTPSRKFCIFYVFPSVSVMSSLGRHS